MANDNGTNTGVMDRTHDTTKRPSMYSVILRNDDFTPQQFVVEMLTKHFRHDADSAYRIMMQVHTNGSGVAGVYTREVAEVKASRVVEEAESHGYPLEATIEPAE